MLRKGSRKRQGGDTKALSRGEVRVPLQGNRLHRRYTRVDRLAHSFNPTGLLIFPDTVLALCYTEKITFPTVVTHVMHMNGLTEPQILHERRRGMVIPPHSRSLLLEGFTFH